MSATGVARGGFLIGYEPGARDLFAVCRRLRIDGFQVDVQGTQAQVLAVLRKLGLSLGQAGLSVPASYRLPPGCDGSDLPDEPIDAA